MLSEACGTSPLEEAVRLIGSRMDVLRACCRGNPSLVNAVIDFVVNQIAEKQSVLSFVYCLSATAEIFFFIFNFLNSSFPVL